MNQSLNEERENLAKIAESLREDNQLLQAKNKALMKALQKLIDSLEKQEKAHRALMNLEK